jgi:hypothetical protein
MSPGVRTGLVVLLFAALNLTYVIFWARRTAKSGGLGGVPPAEPTHAAPAGADYQLELRGGARVNGLNVSWPLATLRVNPQQAELQVWGALEPIRIARTEVTSLYWVGVGLLGPGLKFRTESGRLNKVTVWVGWKARERLDNLGWR